MQQSRSRTRCVGVQASVFLGCRSICAAKLHTHASLHQACTSACCLQRRQDQRLHVQLPDLPSPPLQDVVTDLIVSRCGCASAGRTGPWGPSSGSMPLSHCYRPTTTRRKLSSSQTPLLPMHCQWQLSPWRSRRYAVCRQNLACTGCPAAAVHMRAPNLGSTISSADMTVPSAVL